MTFFVIIVGGYYCCVLLVDRQFFIKIMWYENGKQDGQKAIPEIGNQGFEGSTVKTETGVSNIRI